MIFVELCAGSAAVSLRWLAARAKPPLSYMGGKRGYADAILQAMGQQPGGGRGHEVVLCEPGPWGEAWEHWRTAEGRADTIARLEAWADEDPRTLWERLRKGRVPEEAGERVATWAVLQWWKFARTPVISVEDKWVMMGGFNAADAYATAYNAERAAQGKSLSMAKDDVRLPDVVRALRSLPDLSRLTVHRGPAQALAPIPGAIVYIDPPYEKTSGYGHAFPRAEVLATAMRWREAGCVVAVSEAEPLALPGWHHHALAKAAGFGRTWSKQQAEWLTMTRPAAGQQALF